MASPFDRLMNTVRSHLPGAIDDAIKQELYLVCDDFFNRSDAWREATDIVLKAGHRRAEFMPFAGRTKRLIGVLAENERPVYGAVIAEPGVIQFRHEANQNTHMVAVLSLTVNDPVARDAFPIVPHDIVEQYTAELISGILARMMAQPSKPYSNMNLAGYHLTMFRSGAARAKNAINNGHTFGSQNWRFPSNFRI